MHARSTAYICRLETVGIATATCSNVIGIASLYHIIIVLSNLTLALSEPDVLNVVLLNYTVFYYIVPRFLAPPQKSRIFEIEESLKHSWNGRCTVATSHRQCSYFGDKWGYIQAHSLCCAFYW